MSSNIDLALKVAWSMHGLPYRWGGDDPISGTDCSGFVSEILRSVGAIGPKARETTHSLWQNFQDRVVNHSHIEPGDILLFSSNDGVSGINHTGIAIGNGAMIEAGGGDSSTTSDDQASKQNAFVRVRPIRKNLFAVLRIID